MQRSGAVTAEMLLLVSKSTRRDGRLGELGRRLSAALRGRVVTRLDGDEDAGE